MHLHLLSVTALSQALSTRLCTQIISYTYNWKNPLTEKCTCSIHTLVHTIPWLLDVSHLFLFINFIVFASRQGLIKTLKHCFSLQPLCYNFSIPYVFWRNVRKNTGTDSSRGFTLPDRLYSWVGKVPLSVWKCPLACRTERATCQHPLHLCLRPADLEGNNLAPVELLVGPVWLLALVVKSAPCVFVCVFSLILSHEILGTRFHMCYIKASES